MNPTLNMPGAWANVKEVPPSLLPFNQNQTLYVTKLTTHDAGAPDPEKVDGLKSVEEVLGHYKPAKTVYLTHEDEGQPDQTFTFKKMGDFTQPGLISQSPLMQDQSAKIQDLKKINLHLRSNKMLQKALQNADAKRILLEMIEQMLGELA